MIYMSENPAHSSTCCTFSPISSFSINEIKQFGLHAGCFIPVRDLHSCMPRVIKVNKYINEASKLSEPPGTHVYVYRYKNVLVLYYSENTYSCVTRPRLHRAQPIRHFHPGVNYNMRRGDGSLKGNRDLAFGPVKAIRTHLFF